MSVVWIVEREGIIGSTNTEKLRDALQAVGVPFVGVDPRYFTDDLPEASGVPDGAVRVYYGSTTLRDKLVAAGLPGVFFDPFRFSFFSLGRGYRRELLNFDSRVTTIAGFLEEYETADPDELIFVRPVLDSKELVGAVQTRREWAEAIRVSMNNTRCPTERTAIQIADPRNLDFEWRLFIVDGKVVASSQYRAYGQQSRSAEVPEHVRIYGERMASIYSPARVFTLDVCQLSSDGSLRVVETNCFNCSGFYESDVEAIVRAVTEAVKC